ncbi:flagellar basal body P-ring protein FlgI, partial [Acinetobacter baumannii]
MPAVKPQPDGIFPAVLPVAALFASTPVNDTVSVGIGVFSPGVTLQELVRALNALGIGPRDMIPILQAIKAAGALQAE